jgi:hypothetical protein
VLFDAIFIALFLSGWLLCAFVPWLALSVRTRGNAGLANLPLCLFAGVVAGVAVPMLGLDNAAGILVSLGAAFVAPTLLLAARRFSMGPAPVSRPGTLPPGQQPK